MFLTGESLHGIQQKPLKLQAREGSSKSRVLHQHVYFYPDTTGGNFLSSNITVKPQIQITAYGSKTVIDGFTLTNAEDNRIVTSTGSTGLNCESGLTYDGNTLNVVGNITGDTSLTLDSTTITTAEIGVLDSVTPGTASASKAIVLDSSGNISSMGTVGCGAITSSGEITAASLDISGNVDIDGTLEADAITVNGTALNTVIEGVTVTNATNATNSTNATNVTRFKINKIQVEITFYNWCYWKLTT